MKTIIKIKFLLLLGVCSLKAQDKPSFYTDNGATKVTQGEFKAFKKSNDLTVKTSLPDTLLKYDKVSFIIRGYYYNKIPCGCGPVFRIDYSKSEYNRTYKSSKEISFYVFKPKELDMYQKGDFSNYCNDLGRVQTTHSNYLLPSTGSDGRTAYITFEIKGFMITGEKEVWHSDQSAFIKEPVYSAGDVILRSDELIISK